MTTLLYDNTVGTSGSTIASRSPSPIRYTGSTWSVPRGTVQTSGSNEFKGTGTSGTYAMVSTGTAADKIIKAEIKYNRLRDQGQGLILRADTIGDNYWALLLTDDDYTSYLQMVYTSTGTDTVYASATLATRLVDAQTYTLGFATYGNQLYGLLNGSLTVLWNTNLLSDKYGVGVRFSTSTTCRIKDVRCESYPVSDLTQQVIKVPSQSGGDFYKVVRWSASSSWVNAANTDTVDQLKEVIWKSPNGEYYGPGSILTDMYGLTAGTHYYLDVNGDLTSTAPTPSSTVRQKYVGRAISSTSFYFNPKDAIGV